LALSSMGNFTNAGDDQGKWDNNILAVYNEMFNKL
jgi:hypothetical protein